MVNIIMTCTNKAALIFKQFESLTHNVDLDDVDLTAIGEDVLAEGTVDATTGGVQVKLITNPPKKIVMNFCAIH